MTDHPDAQQFSHLPNEYSNQQTGHQNRAAGDVSRRDLLSNYYKMDYERRGTALIINNKNFDTKPQLAERSGTDRDASALNNRFSELGFDVKLCHNLTKDKMLAQMKAVAEEDHKDADCFVCAILSHGAEDGAIFGTDGTIPLKTLTEPFKGKNCKTLVMKPKIFIIQACQGNQMDEGVNMTQSDAVGSFDDEPEVIKIPNEADFITCYSTIPGFYSWRNTNTGSWYVQALSDVLEKHGQDMELVEMLTLVNKKVALGFQSKTKQPDMDQMKQIPCFTSMLTKKVYFPPKDD